MLDVDDGAIIHAPGHKVLTCRVVPAADNVVVQLS